ncbi:hypothetical protein PoB_006370500 [Plakobranchus ocellatus]|uniref:Uncharacterized protein n=1 Tax=Plakobranchus ocellatus TaxID=259542 RepID=A0AAV4CZJ5_9GAST|nr:hypothetical protein PoB_006370500 [Plakobranchus ocellatus]
MKFFRFLEPQGAVNMRFIIIVLVLSFVVSPLPTDVSNISDSVTVATTSLAHHADFGDLEDYQSNQTVTTSSSLDKHISQKASNPLNIHKKQNIESVKPIPTHGTQNDAVVKTDKSLELLGIENQTLELTTPLFEDTDAKDEPQVLSKLSSQSNTSIDYEEEPRHATSFEFTSRSFPDFDKSDPLYSHNGNDAAAHTYNYQPFSHNGNDTAPNKYRHQPYSPGAVMGTGNDTAPNKYRHQPYSPGAVMGTILLLINIAIWLTTILSTILLIRILRSTADANPS